MKLELQEACNRRRCNDRLGSKDGRGNLSSRFGGAFKDVAVGRRRRVPERPIWAQRRSKLRWSAQGSDPSRSKRS